MASGTMENSHLNPPIPSGQLDLKMNLVARLPMAELCACRSGGGNWWPPFTGHFPVSARQQILDR